MIRFARAGTMRSTALATSLALVVGFAAITADAWAGDEVPAAKPAATGAGSKTTDTKTTAAKKPAVKDAAKTTVPKTTAAKSGASKSGDAKAIATKSQANVDAAVQATGQELDAITDLLVPRR